MGAAIDESGRTVGRYVVYDEIAAGGMASVHLGRLMGAVGFSRTVAIKRLHPHLARDADFATMFLDEARLAARIRHPNVVAVLDVVQDMGELLLVMDYVQGESLSRLERAMRPGAIPPRIAVTVLTGVLHGLHAAHEATTEHGEPLDIVHRDVSPQNVIVGIDGVARVFDFGVAKAAHRVQTTQDGSIKGKISYMSPEQLLGENVDRRADVYSAAVVLWEALTGERLFDGDNQGRMIRKILDEPVPAPSTIVHGLPKAIDEAVMRGLSRDVGGRWQTAREFAAALEACNLTAPATQIGEWVDAIGGSELGERARRVKDIESRSDIHTTLEDITAPDREAGHVPVSSTKRISAVERTGASNGANASDTETMVVPTPRESVLQPVPTVAQGFAVMANNPSFAIPEGTLAPSSTDRPPTGPEMPPLVLQTPSARLPTPSPPTPPPPTSSTRVAGAPARSFVPLAVQTVAVTPLASLQEAAAAKRSGGKRMMVFGLVLALLGVLAVAAAVAWTLIRR